MKAQIISYSFMILLLAAHLLRADNYIPAFIVLLIPLLFYVKKSWVIQVLQVLAYIAAILWMFSAYEYILLRAAEGEDWLRLMIIMFAIALYSAWSGHFLMSDHVKATYGIASKKQVDDESSS